VATLILSTVGTALGGPVGAAIGALIGQSIDQQILGPATRGPRLGDLSVQTSNYGTQVPRIYGRMRVAGSVIWATDLSEGTETTGAKGQPATTFSYSVSFAVALSSRPIAGVGRIWADGKLIRGADGVFTEPTVLRVHDGGEGQEVDPLIATVEGIGNAPAYRGLALAVFEDLALGDFGNRIPFLTFEVIADEADPGVDLILSDVARGAIAAATAQTVIGYAAYGHSIRSAAAPLVEAFGLELFDDGAVVRGPSNAALAVADADLGNSAEGEQVSRIQREQSSVRSVPAALRLAYYDPDRDYQSGEARASVGEQGGQERSSELPAVVDGTSAKAIVHRSLARSWAQRDRLSLRLPPRFLGLEPGERVLLPLSPAEWTVETCSIEGYVMAAGLRPAVNAAVELVAQSGRIAANASAAQEPVTLALFESPDGGGQAESSPTLMLAASSPGGKWKQRRVTVTVAGQSFAFLTARKRSVLGRVLDGLPASSPDLIDSANSVEVELINDDQWLTSCDDESLANGANLAMIGSELVQFGDAAATGPGRFRLSRLLRGRGGTEWAIGGHQSSEWFAMVGDGNSAKLSLPPWVKGATATAGPASGVGDSVAALVGGEALRPPSPVHLSGGLDSSGNLSLQWIRRSRSGWAWLDEVDAPLGESTEQYRVTVAGTAGLVEATSLVPNIEISASDLAGAGTGAAAVEVRHVGDFAVSRPATISIILF